MEKAQKLHNKICKKVRENANIDEIKALRNQLIDEVNGNKSYRYVFESVEKRNEFKIACAKKNKTMKEVLDNLIKIFMKP